MTTGTIVGALLQLVLFGAVGWGVGNALLDRLTRDDAIAPIGPAERSLAAIAGAVAFSAAAMVAHIITGGVVFGVPVVVPVIAIATLVATRHHFTFGGRIPWLKVVAAAVVLGAIYVAPAVIGGSSIRTGDPPWHLGWTEQLLHGEAVPTGPAPEFGRNAYPWGLHAVMATAVRLVPGSTPMVALEMLHLAVLAGIPLAASCLARRVRLDSGWAAAASSSLIGGFGWIESEGADFVASPSRARYGADMVAASPNSVYELFPPALPRELGLVVLGVAGWLVLASVRSRSRPLWFTTGVSLGLVGLISVPLFVTAIVWCAVAAVAVEGGTRLPWLATVGGSGLLVFALWVGPVLSDVVRYGGFVNITPQLGYEWELPVALAGWGLLLPLALAGIGIVMPQRQHRLLVGFAAASTVLLLAAVARGYFDWDLAGNATLFHQGRVWPPLHLLGAVLAGLALAWITARTARRSDWLGPAAIGLVFAIGAASLVLASLGLTDLIERETAGFEYGNSDLASGSFARRAAGYLDPDEVLEVQGSDDLAFVLFQLSGVHLTNYDDPRLEDNDLRIRYAALAEAHDARAAAEGFNPTFMILPAPDAPYDRALERGTFDNRDWILVQRSG